MNQADQLRIVCELTESVKNQFARVLRAGDVPETWDGFEIRQWLADKFEFEKVEMGRKRLREYRNHVATHCHL
jgi:hypothetical protein